MIRILRWPNYRHLNTYCDFYLNKIERKQTITKMSEEQPQNTDLITNEVKGHAEKLIKELGIKNHTTDLSAGSAHGDNYLGIIAKLIVTGEDENGENKTLHLIVKSAPRNEVFRSVAPIRCAYDREIYMYSRVFPEFIKLQEERGILKPFKSIAKFYNSTMEDANEALIMEVMRQLGFEMRDRHVPLNYNHVLLVMKEYGKFHALSFALRDQKPEVFKELFKNTQESFFTTFAKNEETSKSVVQYSERALKALDPIEDKVAYDKFKKFQQHMIDAASDSVQSGPAGKYAVIGHGDSWVNNMLFKYDGSSRHSPSEVCLLDWQLARAGSPALDLAYFIFACTDKQLRDQHYDHLIQEYYDSLSSFLRELGSDPEKLFPYEVLQQHLKKFCVYGLYMAVMVLYMMTSDADEIPDVHNISDMEEAMDKWKWESKNIQKYYSRVRGVILDFVKFGYEF